MIYMVEKVLYLNTNTKSEKARKMVALAKSFEGRAFLYYDAFKAFFDALGEFATGLNEAYPRSKAYTVKQLNYGHGGHIEVVPIGVDNAYKSGYIVRILFLRADRPLNPDYFEGEEYLALVERIKKGGAQ